MRFIFVAIALAYAATTWAGIDAAEFESEELRERYQTLVSEMRCPKCQNQNLAGSNSPISSDLRGQIRRLLLEGASDEEIADYLVARYGDFVRYRPRWQSATYALWLTPFVLFFVVIMVWLLVVRRRTVQDALSSNVKNSNVVNLDVGNSNSTQLNPEEQAALNKVLADEPLLDEKKP